MHVNTISKTRTPGIIPLRVLTPDPILVEETKKPGFFVGSFRNSCEYPPALAELLDECGYVPDDSGRGMLFSSNFGVPLHADEKLSALWVLACEEGGDDDLQIVVGNQYMTLYPGAVLIFDARQDHAVINRIAQRWAVYSMYVKKRPCQKIRGAKEHA